MGFRKFRDRDGSLWEIQPVSEREWRFVPLPGNAKPRVSVGAPGYEKDPFELSEQELQRLVDAAVGGRKGPSRSSPFRD